MNAAKTVFVVSLGCAKNRVDTEHMLGILQTGGAVVAQAPEDADVALINTCGFLESAVEEAIDTVLEMVRLKQQGRLKQVVVTGCFVQRYGYKLRRELPEVDAWLGTGDIHRIAEILRPDAPSHPPPFLITRPTALPDHTMARLQTTPFYSAYLRIAEGCDHRCAYCLIPALRGPFRSRSPGSLIHEAQRMAERGVKEINLIAQDTGMYGQDLGPGFSFEALLENLVKIKGIQWLRILYLHPANLSDRLLDLMGSEPVIVPYLDLPFQHVNADILRAMRRDPDREPPLTTVKQIREKAPGTCIRSTLMTGFPGETESRFQELYDFVSAARLDHLGVFAFSPEKGTRAEHLGPRVEPETACDRMNALLALQADISKKNNQRYVGQTVPVLIEGPSPETELLLCGRTAGMAPEVDGEVLITEGTGMLGEIMPVTITEAHTYDLLGRIVPG